MLSRVMNIDPVGELRSMDDMFNRLFGQSFSSASQSATLPMDVYERDNTLIIRAAVPGVKPEELDVSVENNVLSIRGESRATWESGDPGTKVYRREVNYGSFARSIRLPENLKLDQIDAEFTNGFVEIRIPRTEESKPKSLKVNVRAGDLQTTSQLGQKTTEHKAEGAQAGGRASVK